MAYGRGLLNLDPKGSREFESHHLRFSPALTFDIAQKRNVCKANLTTSASLLEQSPCNR